MEKIVFLTTYAFPIPVESHSKVMYVTGGEYFRKTIASDFTDVGSGIRVPQRIIQYEGPMSDWRGKEYEGTWLVKKWLSADIGKEQPVHADFLIPLTPNSTFAGLVDDLAIEFMRSKPSHFDIDISQYVPPKLQLSERIAFPVNIVAYVNDETESNNVNMRVDGIGFALDFVSRTVTKIGEKYKVIIKANLSCTHESSDLLSFAQNYGVIVLNANGLQIDRDIYWTPIVPFRITPQSVYLSHSGSKQIILEFDKATRIKAVIPENDAIQVHFESEHSGKNHVVTIQLKEDAQMCNDAIITNIILHLDQELFPHLKIPVYVLK